MIDGLFKTVRKAALFSKLMEDFVRLQQEFLRTPNSDAKRGRISEELFMRRQHLRRIEELVPRDTRQNSYGHARP